MANTAPFSLFSHSIDAEIVNLVFNRFWDGLGNVISLVEWQSYRILLLATVRCLYYYISIQFADATLGMKAMDIKWKDKDKRKSCKSLVAGMFLESLLSHGMALIKRKEEQVPPDSRIKYLYQFLHRALFVLHLCSTFNYILFICGGRFPTLLHRLCGYEYVYALKSEGEDGIAGRVNKAQGVLETRKLGWSKVLGLASILFICIDWGKIRGSAREGGLYIHNLYTHLYRVIGARLSGILGEGGDQVGNSGNNTIESAQRTGSDRKIVWQCADCGTSPPENPQIQPCGHAICYVCWGRRTIKVEGADEVEKWDGDNSSCSLCSFS